MPKKAIIYLYKRKYPKIENYLELLSSKFVCQSFQVTSARAFAFSISKVPAVVLSDKNGNIRATHQGLESVLTFLDMLNEEK